MKNILYYMKRYGNKSFEEFPLNEVDGLILSQLSYLNLDTLIPSIDDTKEDVSLIDCFDSSTIKAICQGTLDRKNNEKLIFYLKKSLRFKKLKANYFTNLFNVDEVLQFCAMTFFINNTMFITYRGTDVTLLGWKEDLNMSFLEVIPSQKEASRYFERVGNKRDLPIYVCGHSKGGNLAVYASLSVKEELQSKIKLILDYDGPGFQTDIYKTKEFHKIEHRIKKFSCGNAMIGILLYHSNHIHFVKARGVSIFQHDPYNWLLTKKGTFRYVKSVTIFSLTFEKTVGDFIETTSIDNRKKFLHILYKVGMEHSYATVLDWFRHPIRSLVGIFKRYKNLTKAERIYFKKMVHRYRILWQENFKLFFKKKMRKSKTK